MHTHKRESYFPFRLRKTVIPNFFFFPSNLKWELQEAPSLSIKAATLRIKIFQRNVSAQVINSWGWALNKLSLNSSLLAHLCSTSVTPANTSHSPELLFQPLLKHQDEPPALLLLPGVPPFTTQLVHNQHLAFANPLEPLLSVLAFSKDWATSRFNFFSTFFSTTGPTLVGERCACCICHFLGLYMVFASLEMLQEDKNIKHRSTFLLILGFVKNTYPDYVTLN